MVVGIIKPRLEETFELLKDKLDHSGLGKEGGARVVLTGGASQLVGVREMAARILDRQVRLGRPHALRGLAEAASGPAFAGAVGLLMWGAGEGRPVLDIAPGPVKAGGAFRRLIHWLKDRV
jgi:cell division protein FtsA